jgi:hypothetical protein
MTSDLSSVIAGDRLRLRRLVSRPVDHDVKTVNLFSGDLAAHDLPFRAVKSSTTTGKRPERSDQTRFV